MIAPSSPRAARLARNGFVVWAVVLILLACDDAPNAAPQGGGGSQ
jgi:hypothetical protein